MDTRLYLECQSGYSCFYLGYRLLASFIDQVIHSRGFRIFHSINISLCLLVNIMLRKSSLRVYSEKSEHGYNEYITLIFMLLKSRIFPFLFHYYKLSLSLYIYIYIYIYIYFFFFFFFFFF